MKKTAIFFDVDDTLLDNHNAFRQTLCQLWPNWQVSQGELMRLYQKFRADSETIYAQAQTEKAHVFLSSHERWAHLIKEIGASGEQSPQQADQLYHKYQQQENLSPEWVQLFKQLQNQTSVQVGVFTNGFKKVQQKKIAQLKLANYLVPEWLLISEAFGDAKPNVSCFEKLKICLPSTIEQFIYLGDSYRNDIVPSLAAGWQPIWINRFEETRTQKGVIEATSIPEAVRQLQQLL
ncbi:HAD family hydrolase [Enterococcus pallens]|uniref:HAD hydrolase, family IA n=1 Tax=Enterococcus pallens ATCC BAA-351 TaxID=1158607 RepID=R2SQP4_9ENTE|nr:HAD family hydrolase [Enterococcus pallens]EOH97580.1 HAD hydrolase, family IA [Enterococcus pallens ATCC BAA-351]EOU21001.1 hypothetical protein I588_01848 [Enterococcus pallens ATCC BAA-351]OJG80119.1 HAD hydrolase, family IA [Enterococcus pallens]